MKVIVKWRKGILVSILIIIALAIYITVGSKGDEKSKLGYTVYQSSGALTHINQFDINISSPKSYMRFFPDSQNKYVASEMNGRGMSFVALASDYSYVQEFYIFPEGLELSEAQTESRVRESQGSYDLTSDLTHDDITVGNLKLHRVCYSRKDIAYLDFDVVADYFTEHNGMCLEIRSYVEYGEEPKYQETLTEVCKQAEEYFAEYSYGTTQVQPKEKNALWDWWKSLNFAPWVLLLPFLYMLLCGITFTGFSEKIYVPETKKYRFVGDEGTGWNEEYLSLNVSKMLLGICAVLVVCHHLVQQADKNDTGMLTFLENFGVGFVGMFFFFSGFGLYESLQKKEGYMKGFLKKRLPSVLIPSYIAILVFVLVELLQNGLKNKKQFPAWLTGWKLINPQMWYIVEIVILYLIFFLLFRFIKNRKICILLLFLCTGLMVAMALLHGHGDGWFQGEWWYNTSLLFPFGVLFAAHKDEITYFAKRFYIVVLPAVVIGFVLLYKARAYMLETYGYWSETPADPGYDDKLRCFITECPMVLFFVLLMLALGLKLKIGNRALKFMGSISLELYLIHYLFINLFSGIKGTGAFFFSVLAASILAACVLHFVITCIFCLIRKQPLPDIMAFKRIIPEYFRKKKSDAKEFHARVKRSLWYAARNKKTTGRIFFRHFVCLFLCAVALFPILLLVINATKSKYDLVRGISFLPGGKFAENFLSVKDFLHTIGLNLYEVVGLSCVISITCTFLGTYIGAMCAYGFEYFDFKRKKPLWRVIILALMMPAAAASVGFFKLVYSLRLYNRLFPIIMAGITIPSCVYFMRMYLQTVKLKEIIEAARIDGCRELHVFNKIILPIIRPAVLLQLVINFANNWNNTVYQNLVLIDPHKKSISVFLNTFAFGEGAGSDPALYCLLLVATIPSLVIFILFSHGIAARINLGGIKE